MHVWGYIIFLADNADGADFCVRREYVTIRDVIRIYGKFAESAFSARELFREELSADDADVLRALRWWPNFVGRVD